jgi:hypothetical protein
MIGGPPIAQPYYPYPYQPPVANAPGSPGYVQQPPYVRPAQPRTPPPNQLATLPRMPAPPVVRGQKPDEPPARPALKLDMPAPEALGVPVPAAPPDWTTLRVRLDRIGATGFALDSLPEGGYRFRCQVPTTNGPRPVEGRAASEGEAVNRAIEAAGK